jgi:hypothetical protein
MSQPRKPRARSVPCDPQRWPPCVRCGQSYRRAHRWPEGRICHYCYEAARQRHGHCATCGHTGVLPGLASDGQPTCLTCSGIPLQMQCRSCGAESPLGRGSRCWRCQLADLVNSLLQGPDGLIPPSLQPLAQAVINMPRPHSGYAWLRQNPAAQDLLRQLGQASTQLSHEDLDQLTGTRTVVDDLRDFQIVSGFGATSRGARIPGGESSRPLGARRRQRPASGPHRVNYPVLLRTPQPNQQLPTGTLSTPGLGPPDRRIQSLIMPIRSTSALPGTRVNQGSGAPIRYQSTSRNVSTRWVSSSGDGLLLRKPTSS